MLRARSELFFEQGLARARQLTILKAEEVLQGEPSKTRLGTFDTTLKVGAYAMENEAERETLLRNKTITDMRGETANGPAWLSKLHWCLQFTEDPTNPVIAADNAVVLEGTAPTLERAPRDHETLVFFPICWQACLIGSPARIDKETDSIDASDLRRLQALYLKLARGFVYSPACLDF